MNLQEAIQKIKTETGFLGINLSNQHIKDSEVAELGKAIVISKLSTLALNLAHNQITNIDELGKGIVANTKLTSFELCLSNNQIKDVESLGKAIETNTTLTRVKLEFQHNQIKNVDELSKAVAVNTKLTSLTLWLNNNQIKNVDELGKAIAINTKLTTLALSLEKNQITNINELGKGIAANTKLTGLSLYLANNQITNVDKLGKGIAINAKLTLLHLHLARNQIKNVDELGKGLTVNTKLTSVYLHLDNNQIKNLDALGKAVVVNTKLTSLYLDLSNNQIQNGNMLGKAIAINTKLTSLKLYLHYNQITNVDKLGKGIATNTKLTKLSLGLSNNQINNEGAKILSDAIRKSSIKITLYYNANTISEEVHKALKSALALNKDAKHREIQKEKNIPYTIQQFGQNIANKDIAISDLIIKIDTLSIDTVTKKNRRGNGVLDLAFRFANLDVVTAVINQIKLLDNSSCDLIKNLLSTKNGAGFSPLAILANRNDDIIEQILVVLLQPNDNSEKEFAKVILIDKSSSFNDSLEHLLAEKGKFQSLMKLVEYKMSLNVEFNKNRFGDSFWFELCLDNHYDQVINFLDKIKTDSAVKMKVLLSRDGGDDTLLYRAMELWDKDDYNTKALFTKILSITTAEELKELFAVKTVVDKFIETIEFLPELKKAKAFENDSDHSKFVKFLKETNLVNRLAFESLVGTNGSNNKDVILDAIKDFIGTDLTDEGYKDIFYTHRNPRKYSALTQLLSINSKHEFLTVTVCPAIVNYLLSNQGINIESLNAVDNLEQKINMIKSSLPDNFDKCSPILNINERGKTMHIFNYNTTFRSKECFKAFEPKNINLCFGNTSTRIISQEKANTYRNDTIALNPTSWQIKIDICLKTLSDFVAVCIREFESKGLHTCNGVKPSNISNDTKELDINYQTTTTFNSDICFKTFHKNAKKVILNKTKLQVVSTELWDQCADQDSCFARPSWMITSSGCTEEDSLLGVCKKEFESKNLFLCDN